MKYLTINAAAEALSVHPNTIRNHLTEFGAVDMHGGRSKNRLLRIPETVIDSIIRERAIRDPITKVAAKPSYKLERR